MLSARHIPLLVVAALLSAVTVYIQFKALGYPYLETRQLERHEAVLNGTAGDPWQYRVLSEWAVEVVLDVCRTIGITFSNGFLIVRFLQNVLIFVLAFAWMRALAIPARAAYLGLALIAWAMTQALFDSDLQFNTYSDIIFYLAAALLIVRRRWGWLIPLVALGALNRETIGLVPVMLVAGAVAVYGLRAPETKRAALYAGAAFAAYALVTVVLRAAVGPGEIVLAYGQHPGSELFSYNVERPVSWTNLFVTLNVLPFLALWWIRDWPRWLLGFGAAVVPVWFAVHFVSAVVAETRLFLVPLALVFVPGVLAGVTAMRTSGPAAGTASTGYPSAATPSGPWDADSRLEPASASAGAEPASAARAGRPSS